MKTTMVDSEVYVWQIVLWIVLEMDFLGIFRSFYFEGYVHLCSIQIRPILCFSAIFIDDCLSVMCDKLSTVESVSLLMQFSSIFFKPQFERFIL